MPLSLPAFCTRPWPSHPGRDPEHRRIARTPNQPGESQCLQPASPLLSASIAVIESNTLHSFGAPVTIIRNLTMSTLPLPMAAFVAGLISFLSPCVLPLVPGYVSLISGVGIEQLKSQEQNVLRKVMLNSISFILGFSVVFIALGAISTELGQALAMYKAKLAVVAGVVIIIFGLHLTG